MSLLSLLFAFCESLLVPGFLLTYIASAHLNLPERLVFGSCASIGLTQLTMMAFMLAGWPLQFYSIALVQAAVTVSLVLVLGLSLRRASLVRWIRNQRLPQSWNVSLWAWSTPLLAVILVFVCMSLFIAWTQPFFSLEDSLVVYGPYSSYIYNFHSYPWAGSSAFVPASYAISPTELLQGYFYLALGGINERVGVWIPIVAALILVGVASWASRLTRSKFKGLLAAVVLTLVPDFALRSYSLHIDVPFTLLWIGSCYCLYLLLNDQTSDGMAVLAGVLLGALMLAKIEGAVLVLALVVFALLPARWQSRGDRDYRKSTIVVVVVGILFASITYLSSEIHFGNPIYPWFQQILGGNAHTASIAVTQSPDLLLGVSRLSYSYLQGEIHALVALPPFSAGTVPSLLSLLGLLWGFYVLATRRTRGNTFVLVAAALLFAFWYSSSLGTRQLLPLFAMTVVPFSLLLPDPTTHSVRSPRLTKFASVCLCICILVVPFAAVTVSAEGMLSPSVPIASQFGMSYLFAGRIDNPNSIKLTAFYGDTPAQYYRAHYGTIAVLWDFLDTLPSGSVILTQNPEVYYVHTPMIWDQNPGINQIYLQQNLDAVLKILRSYGITYILYEAGYARSNPVLAANVLWQSLGNSSVFTPAYTTPAVGGTVVYSITYPPSLNGTSY